MSAPRTGPDPAAGERSAGTGRLRSAFPGYARVRQYRRSWLRGDMVAGCTVAGYLIPQVMAYAAVAGLPPVTGLWAIMASLAVYAVLGSSPQLSVGPESTTAFMTAAAVAPLAAGDPHRYAGLAAALALLVGALCLVARLVRLGFVADLLSRPVLIGYMAGVAVMMIISQLGKVTAVHLPGGQSPLAELGALLRRLGSVNGPTLTLAAAVLAGLVLGTRYLPRAPVPL
ncbi:MAG TPA: SulP family inorganic anion transporter, partial [Kineosporiaceae bacterium]|nr:SulP family inorganic anion transporter [Kineosporiaceae bacterium]